MGFLWWHQEPPLFSEHVEAPDPVFVAVHDAQRAQHGALRPLSLRRDVEQPGAGVWQLRWL